MNRYELEHSILPSRFYEDCEGMIKEIEEKGAEYFVAAFEAGEGSPWTAEQFDAGLLEYEGGVNILRAFLPKPETPAQSAALYLLYDQEYAPLRYLTVELDPDGKYILMGWDQNLTYKPYGDFSAANERTMIDEVVKEVLNKDEEVSAGLYGEMRELLKANEIPFHDDEVADYIQMFDVISELIEHRLEKSELVAVFAKLIPVMKDTEIVTSRAKMKTMYENMDEFPESAGKLDRKAKLFIGFSVYAAVNILSENDDKKHYYMGIPEFQSVDYIKYKMEEYWAMDPYMFSFAF